MSTPALASRFVQVAWVVRDIHAAEAFFKKVMGVPRFLQIHNLKAKDTNGTYMGQPADWVIHLSIAYAGETQIELIQPVSGASVYQEWLDKHGEDGVQRTGNDKGLNGENCEEQRGEMHGKEYQEDYGQHHWDDHLQDLQWHLASSGTEGPKAPSACIHGSVAIIAQAAGRNTRGDGCARPLLHGDTRVVKSCAAVQTASGLTPARRRQRRLDRWRLPREFQTPS